MVDSIVSIEEIGEFDAYDIWNASTNNFVIDGVLVHNSIPEAVANRNDKSGKWKEHLHPDILPILEDTYGVICFAEDTMVSMTDGSCKPIQDIKAGDRVVSVDGCKLVTRKVECAGPTVKGDGVTVTLQNGLHVTVTREHEFNAFECDKRAEDLQPHDMLMVPTFLPAKKKESMSWVMAYLAGHITACGRDIKCASMDDAELLAKWFTERGIPSMPVMSCGSCYITIDGNPLDYYDEALIKLIIHSGPEARAAFIAGRIDAYDSPMYSKTSWNRFKSDPDQEGLLLQLTMIDGYMPSLYRTPYKSTITIQNSHLLMQNVADKFLLKRIPEDATTSTGLIDQARGIKNGRRAKAFSAGMCGVQFNDVAYFRVESVKRAKNKQFYNLSVEGTHKVIVNGIVAKQCYQEQLQQLWQRVAGFSSPEAQEARKAVAKKWVEKLKPVREKWITGASRVLGKEEAEAWWKKMETFGRYAFNRCLSSTTPLTDCETGETKTVEEWFLSGQFPKLQSFCDGELKEDECVGIYDSGEQELYEVEFDDGTVERVTADHKFLCADGKYHELFEIVERGLELASTGPNCREEAQNPRQDKT